MSVYNKKKGALLLLSSSLCFSTMNVFSRLAGDIPAMEKTLFRNVFSVIVILVYCLVKKLPVLPRKKALPAHLIRSLFGVLTVIGNYYAMDRMILSDATMIEELMPFLVILYSALFLREKAGWKQYGTVLMALAGAAFVIKPSAAILSQPGTLAALGVAFGGGLAYFALRWLGREGESGTVVVLFFSVFSVLFCLPPVLMNPAVLSGTQVLYLIIMSALACAAQFALTAAYRYAPPSEISILDYSQILFSAIYGWLFFGQVSDRWSYLGYVVMITAAVLSFRMKKKEN